MNIVKKSFAIVVCALALSAQAQDKSVAAAFSQSYDYEAIKKYDAAIASLTKVYDESSYELNMRLGWLYYSAGKSKESVAYYQKAINLMPAATEPLWAIINPLSVLENWNDIEKNILVSLN